MDIRAEKLAGMIAEYSIEVKNGDIVIIDTECPEHDICVALIKAIYDKGGRPVPLLRNMACMRRIIEQADDEQMILMRKSEEVLIEQADSYILIGGNKNNAELSGVSKGALARYVSVYKEPLGRQRLRKKWLVLRLPTPAEAQVANMNTDDYTDLLYQSCGLDYKKLLDKMQPLYHLMENTEQVHIEGEDTDLTFSIKGIPVLCAAGKVNLPDGEVYTAPVRESINGKVYFNTKTVYQGCVFDAVKLVFENGKVVSAEGSNKEKLNEILDIDEGARYVGEFALGLNPVIKEPVGSILFDEKIGGSFHLALGNCYEEAPNGNHSSIHWDLVCRQQLMSGTNRIYFDGLVISENGRFCIPELEPLNN